MHNYVIKVYQEDLEYAVIKTMLHKTLETSQQICQPEWHLEILKWCDECSLETIFLVH